MRIIELEEEQATEIPKAALREDWALQLSRKYGKLIQVEFPGPHNDRRYILRPRSCVGQILLGDYLLNIRSKVGVENVFGMLEYGYQLALLETGNRLVDCKSISEIFERLASILARKVLERAHRGLLRDYVEREGELPYLRGRLIGDHLRIHNTPNRLNCRFQDHTTNLLENRILAWTLYCLRLMPLQSSVVKSQIRQAFRAIAGTVELKRISPEECMEPIYNSLNMEYRPMHALCRFFLEQCGPGLGKGGSAYLPVVVNMPLLFERFVAAWLVEYVPRGLKIKSQHRAQLEGSEKLAFQIDMVLVEEQTGEPLAVLDTKYKTANRPEEDDIKQVLSYAVRMGTEKAFLIYPTAEMGSFTVKVGAIEIHSISFDIARNLQEAGCIFLENLLENISFSPITNIM